MESLHADISPGPCSATRNLEISLLHTHIQLPVKTIGCCPAACQRACFFQTLHHTSVPAFHEVLLSAAP